ncbi:MAG TPA: NAD(P)-dependent oxidoreductase [Pyrinomonadaceae bacterium]|nr:NAD(P)-dependent oxidoreductase [Pyrinomonadaceae bacterium]
MSNVYFVTGAQGFIGSWVVKALVERGDVPVVFDRSDDSRRLAAVMDESELARVRFTIGDITDGAAVRRAVESSGARRVIHLAGLQVPTCKADPIAGALVNVVGTLNIFEAARYAGAERVVYASSAAVFGMSEESEPLDETAACDPNTHYGVFKRANEGNARIYFLDHGLSSAGLRPYTVYGVGRDTGITSDPTKAMKAAILGRPFHIRFGGATDFQYVADTAAAFIACADRAPAGAFVFNLHGETTEVAEMVRVIDEELPAHQRGLVTFGGAPIPVAPHLSDAAIRATIGDVPSTPLVEGVRETIKRFSELREAGRLDTSDIDAELGAKA